MRLARLKKQGWINELMCGIDREDGLQCNSMFSMMVMELSLTEDGLTHYQDVISAVCVMHAQTTSPARRLWPS
jgi:secreted Zn-dependent insulinase-like peptidase